MIAETSDLIWDSARVIYVRHERRPDRLRDDGACAKSAHHYYQHDKPSRHQNIISESLHLDPPSLERRIRFLPIRNTNRAPPPKRSRFVRNLILLIEINQVASYCETREGFAFAKAHFKCWDIAGL